MKKPMIVFLFLLLISVYPIHLIHADKPPIKVDSPNLDVQGRISKSELLDKGQLILNRSDCRIVSFTLTFVNSRLHSQSFHSGSSAFTSSMLNEIRQGHSSERFILSNLVVKTPNDSVYVNPITFYLKE